MKPFKNKIFGPAALIISLILVLILPGCGKVMTVFGHQSPRDSFLENTVQLSTEDIDNFKAGLKPINGEIKAKYLLARHFQKLNRHLNAIDELNEIIKVEPLFPEAYNALGVSYDSLGKFSMAEECYQMALRLNPRLAFVVNNLGYSYLIQGKNKDAVKYLEMAVAMEENNLKYRNNLMMAYQGSGKKKQKSKEDLSLHSEPEEIAENQIEQGPSIKIMTTANEAPAAKNNKTAKYNKRNKSPRFYKISSPAPVDTQNTEKKDFVITVAELTDENSSLKITDTESQKQPPQASPDPLDIKLVNGNGITGFAKKIAKYLREKGYRIISIKNGDHFNYQETRIYFHKNLKENASLLSEQLLGEKVISDTNMIYHDEKYIRVLLGKDMVTPNHGEDKKYKVEISNGNGVTGAAKRMAQYLRSKGIPVYWLTNADHFNHEVTCIFFGKGRLNQAQALMEILPDGGQANLVEIDQDTNRVRLLLGKDMAVY